MTLEEQLRRSLRRAKARKKRVDTLRLRALRSFVNDFQISPTDVAGAFELSPETVRIIARGEGAYKRLPDLGPERVRWIGEWIADYVALHGTGDLSKMLQSTVASLPRLVKDDVPKVKGKVA